MPSSRALGFHVFYFVFAMVSLFAASGYCEENSLKTEDLIPKHLDAIGSGEARAAAKTRVVQGAAVYRILVGGRGRAEGKTGLVSEDHKLRFMVKLPGTDYLGETLLSMARRFAWRSRSPTRAARRWLLLSAPKPGVANTDTANPSWLTRV